MQHQALLDLCCEQLQFEVISQEQAGNQWVLQMMLQLTMPPVAAPNGHEDVLHG